MSDDSGQSQQSATAVEMLSSSPAELRAMARRVQRALTIFRRERNRANELARKLAASEPSMKLQAENNRLRKDRAGFLYVIAAFVTGNTDLGIELASIMFPTARRFGELVLHDPAAVTVALHGWSEEKNMYFYDAHGHRSRTDLVDEHNECPECKRENIRSNRHNGTAGGVA